MRKDDVPDLIWQFSVLGTGNDDNATGAWVWTKIQQHEDVGVKQAIERANAHWDASSEDLKDAMGPFFGLGEPSKERWPTLQAIKADYEVVLSLCMVILDEPY